MSNKFLPYDIPPDVVKAIENLMDTALQRQTEPKEDGETFTLCRVCGKWEDHSPGCPMPAMIEFWES